MDEPTYKKVQIWDPDLNRQFDSQGFYAEATALHLSRVDRYTGAEYPVYQTAYVHEDTGIVTTNVEAFERFYYGVNAANKGE
jgi:hypothetical protein